MKILIVSVVVEATETMATINQKHTGTGSDLTVQSYWNKWETCLINVIQWLIDTKSSTSFLKWIMQVITATNLKPRS